MLFLILVTLMTPNPSDGGGDPKAVFDHPVDSAEHQALARVGRRLQEVKTLRSTFRQEKRIASLRRPLRSSGRFLFSIDDGVCWQTDKPFPNLFVLTNEKIYQKSEGGPPLEVKASERPMIHGFTKVFLSLFAGDTEALEERFELFFRGTAEDWTLGLKPKGRIMKRVIDNIVLEGGDHMETVWFAETSGDVAHIVFENVVAGSEPLDASERGCFAH